MSFIKGKKNLYSLINNSIINHIQKKSLNNTLLKDKNKVKINQINDQSNQPVYSDPSVPTLFISQPKNLISNSNINIDCDNSGKCLQCIINNTSLTSDMLVGDNYNKNIDIINNERNGECASVCKCDISYVNLETNLLFSVGVNINFTKNDSKTVTDSIISNLTTRTASSSSSSSYNPNYFWLLLGVFDGGLLPGLLLALTTGSDSTTNTISENINKTVYNISQLYLNSINQLISSSQTIQLYGTGIKAKNISLSSLQDITMSASESNCSDSSGDTSLNCIDGQVSDITNSLMSIALTSLNYSEGLLSYMYNQNKTIIWVLLTIVVVFLFLYVFLLIKKALKK